MSEPRHISALIEDLIHFTFYEHPVHDEPMYGAWTCGNCPYMNVGPMCTKCGADRWEGLPAVYE